MPLAVCIGVPLATLSVLIKRTLVVLLPLICTAIILTVPLQVPDLLTDQTTARALPLLVCLLYATGQTWFWTRQLIAWQLGYRSNYLVYDCQGRSFLTLCDSTISATGTYLRPIILQNADGGTLVLFSLKTLAKLSTFYAAVIPLAFSQMLYQNIRHDALDFLYLMFLAAAALYFVHTGYVLLSDWYWDRRDVSDDADQRIRQALTQSRSSSSILSLLRFLFLQRSSILTASLAALPIFLVWYSAQEPGKLAELVGAEGILFLAIGSIVAILALVSLVLVTIRLPPVTALLLWLIFVSVYAPTRHDVPVRGSAELPLVQKAAVPQEFCRWLAANGSSTTCNTPGSTPPNALPIIFVSASGGGLRAAYWTGSMLGALSDCVPGFDSAVFSVSAVSGGSLGAALYELGVRLARTRERNCQLFQAAAAKAPDSTHYSVRELVRDALSNDYLAPLAERLFFGDLFSTFLPMQKFSRDRLTDRGDALRNSWQDSFRAACERSGASCAQADTLGTYLLDSRRQPEWAPLAVYNSTHLETGVRLLNSTARFKSSGLDFHEVTRADLTVGDAVLNSARFPLISPAGKINSLVQGSTPEERGHAIDGAYADNSGLETTYEIAREVLATAHALNVPVMPIFLNIENDPTLWTAMRKSPSIAAAFFKDGRNEITQAEAEAAKALLRKSGDADIWRELLVPLQGVVNKVGTAVNNAGIWHELLVPLRGMLNAWPVAAQQKPEQLFASAREVNLRLCPDDEHNVTLGWKLSQESRTVIEKVLLETPPIKATPEAISILFEVETTAISDEEYLKLWAQGAHGREEARERMNRYWFALEEYHKIDSSYEALFGKRRYGEGFGDKSLLGRALMLNLCHNAIHDGVRKISEAIGAPSLR